MINPTGVPLDRPDSAELIHHNAILGCRSWRGWKNLSFEESENLTWYHSSIKDILFNSVLSANLSETIFPSLLEEVVRYCVSSRSSLAWLIPLPQQLKDFHRNHFARHGFRECLGTTGMLLELENPSLKPLYLPKIKDPFQKATVQIVESDKELRSWAEVLIRSYQFPEELAECWFDLHRNIGYRTSTPSKDQEPFSNQHIHTLHKQTPWQHFILREGEQIVATSSLFCGEGPLHSSFANLAVIPEMRGTGKGSRLVRHCLGLLAEYGYTAVTLYASQDAFELYSRLGFQPAIRNTFFVKDSL